MLSIDREMKSAVLLVALCAISICHVPVNASSTHSPPSVIETDTKDGSDLLQSLYNNTRKWSDYSCESALELYRPNKVTHSGCRFFYKQNQVRVEVMGGGFRDGSVLVKEKDGKV